MQKIEFEVKENIELIKAIINELPFLSRFEVNKLFQNKRIVPSKGVHKNPRYHP